MWALSFSADAAKTFRKLDKKVQRDIQKKLTELQGLEFPGQMAKPLTHDLKNRWRLHIGVWRVIFRLENDQLVILVVDIGKRDAVYD